MSVVARFDTQRESRPPQGTLVYTEPTEVASFSRDGSGQVHLGGKDNMRAYKDPPTPSDLSEGFPHKFVDKDSTRGFSIDPILSTLKEKKFSVTRAGIRFLSFRNNFNKIMGTPYNDKDNWSLEIHRLQGTLYMNICDSGRPENESDRQKLQTYWGYKFESLCTSGAGQHTVDPNEEFCSIVQARLQSHRICLSGEIDCFDSTKGAKPELCNYMELKTSVYPEGKAKWSFDRFKLLSTWVQSYLVGVPTVAFGWRDFNGVLQGSRQFNVLDLPSLANEGQFKWDPMVCLAFTDRLLSWLWANTADGGQYSLQYLPNGGRSIVLTSLADKPTFLPDWWLAHISAQ